MQNITPEELKNRIQNGEKLNIVDVREPWEYEEDNLGALNIPLNTLPARLNELEAYKNQELIVHCRSGARSSNAKKFLEGQGYSHVRNLLKGLEGYRAQGV